MSDRELTHVDEQGRVQMVDVGAKEPMRREAVAQGRFHAPGFLLDRLMAGDLPKGEALATARIAGIQAAKKCDELIPLCHSLPLDGVAVSFSRENETTVVIEATSMITAKTGVEMEALTAVSVAALTLWDMSKAVSRDLRISDIELISKTKTAV